MTAVAAPTSILSEPQRRRLALVLSTAVHANLATPPCAVLCDVCAAAMRVITHVAEPMIRDAQLEQLAINIGKASTPRLIG